MTRPAWPLAVVGLLAACAAPSDSFEVGERSLLVQDLPAALVAFDAVPVSHERYPEARATALTVERRMRRGHELLLEALLLRGEWRDREALQALRRARVIWPRMPGVDALIAATEHRVSLLGEEARAAAANPIVVPMVEVPKTVTQVEPRPRPQPWVPEPGVPEQAPGLSLPPQPPAEERSAAAGDDDAVASVAPTVPAQERVAVAEPAPHADPVALGLVAVETRLGRGDVEAALVDLIELSERFPEDRRVALRLARVLHQRALMRYGNGQLAAAISDWERVLVLDGNNKLAETLLDSARAEAAAAAPIR